MPVGSSRQCVPRQTPGISVNNAFHSDAGRIDDCYLPVTTAQQQQQLTTAVCNYYYCTIAVSGAILVTTPVTRATKTGRKSMLP